MSAVGCPGDDALARLVREARARGWREALEATCGDTPELRRYASDPREGDCLLLLPSTSAAHRALFLGNAVAAMPFLLAERLDSVVVADHAPRRLEFAEQRAREDGVRNVSCTVADRVRDVAGSFDLVVLGEECPDARASVPFSDVRSLEALRDLVNPGGCLLYGVRARRCHPSRVATPWARRVSASFPAHVGHLRRSFATVAAYWRSPARRPYHVYAPLDGSAALRYWVERLPPATSVRARVLRRAVDVASRIGGLAPLIDNFVVVARRA